MTDLLKPLLLLACVAFVIGFVSYWGMARVAAWEAPQPQTHATWQTPTAAPASAPSADGWNAEKRI